MIKTKNCSLELVYCAHFSDNLALPDFCLFITLKFCLHFQSLRSENEAIPHSEVHFWGSRYHLLPQRDIMLELYWTKRVEVRTGHAVK